MGPHAQDETCQPLSGAGTWTFTVTLKGHVTDLGLVIKNNPGAADRCFFFGRTFHGLLDITVTVLATDIPAASTGVCGTTFPDTNGPALDVFAFIQGGKDSDVKIHVVWPDPAP